MLLAEVPGASLGFPFAAKLPLFPGGRVTPPCSLSIEDLVDYT